MTVAIASSTEHGVPTAMVEDAVARVLSSEVFAEVPRLSRFLDFVVAETLAGRGDRLKGFVIACEVFDKTDPSEAQSTTIVRVEAGRLRRRLDDYYNGPGRDDELRITIPKGGYKPVFAQRAQSQLASDPPVAPPPSRRLTSHRQYGLVAIAALILVATGLFFTRQETPFPAAATGMPTLAVLPLESYDGINEGKGRAIADSLVAALSKRADLQVIALSSIDYFRTKITSVRDIARQMAVTHVVKGGYSQSAKTLDITLTLHDAHSGYAVWSDEFSIERPVDAQQVTQRLKNGITGQLGLEPETSITTQAAFDGDRHTLYTQARNLSHPPANRLRVTLSLGMFDTLLSAYPDYAGAYAGSAYTRAALLWWRHSEQPGEDERLARQHALQALELDPASGLAHLALGMLAMAQRDHDSALSHMRRAVEVQPSNSLALSVLGIVEVWTGDNTNSVDRILAAIRLDPLNPRAPYWNLLGAAHFHQGNFSESTSAYRENIRRGGPRAPNHDYYLAAALVADGRQAEAEAFLAQHYPDGPVLGWLPWLSDNFRDRAAFAQLLTQLEKLDITLEPNK